MSRFESGDSEVVVYASQYGGTSQATTATWVVDDVDGNILHIVAH